MYILSESSLFVYSNRLMIKTCGDIRLLLFLGQLCSLHQKWLLDIETILYSRKDYLLPHLQKTPYGHWPREKEFLKNQLEESRHQLENGTFSLSLPPFTVDDATMLGWHICICSFDQREKEETKRIENVEQHRNATILPKVLTHSSVEEVIEIMMENIPVSAVLGFFGAKSKGEDLWNRYLPIHILDEFYFTPCGYSMNASVNVSKSKNDYWRNELMSRYATIHISPEPHNSYMSLETDFSNIDLEAWFEKYPCRKLTFVRRRQTGEKRKHDQNVEWLRKACSAGYTISTGSFTVGNFDFCLWTIFRPIVSKL